MVTNEQLQARLAEAETALHQIMTGTSTVEVSYNGRQVQYSRTNAGDLRAYILDLKVQLGIKTGRSRAILARF